MLRRGHLIGFVAIAAIVVAGFYIVSVAQSASAQKEAAQATACAPEGCCGAMMGPEMMKGKSMSPEMMRNMQAMMNMPVFLDSPCAINGQAESLGLSDEQQKKLVKIENNARQKALAVLTPEQREKLGDIPDKPVTMMGMCKEMGMDMMPMMHGMMGGKGPAGKCPMMGKTPGGAADEGTGPKTDK